MRKVILQLVFCIFWASPIALSYAGEGNPQVRVVQSWALQAAGFGLARYDSAWRRMRVAGWAPEFKVGWLSGEDRSSRSQYKVSLDELEGDGSNTQSTRLDSRFELSLRWRLDELVSHPREVTLLREIRHAAAARLLLLERVTKLYFEWVEATRKRDEHRPDEAEYQRISAVVTRLVAQLDAFTAGRFSGGALSEGQHD